MARAKAIKEDAILMTNNSLLIPIQKLKLDPNNPRFDKSADQLEATAKLFQSEKTNMVNLAADIAEHGLNPTQLLTVLPEDDWYIVLEGNRRLACVLGLIDPNRVPAEYRAAFQRLSIKASIPKVVFCYVVSKRSDASGWIQERHTGLNDGVGVSSWDTEQQRRFIVNTRGTPDRTLQLVEWIKANTPDIAKQYQERNMFTNIERLIDDEAVREKLGLRYESGQLRSVVSFNSLKKAIGKIVKDFHSGMTVDTIKNKTDRSKYINSIDDFLPGPKDATQEVALSSLASTKSVAREKSPPARNPLDRRILLTKDFKFACSNDRIMSIVFELRHLDLDKYPNGAAMLLRAFIEMATYLYAKKKGVPKVSGTQGKWDSDWNIVIEYFEAGQMLEPSQIKALRKLSSNKEQMLSYDTLHQCVHNKDFFPTKSDLIRIWSMVEPYLYYIGQSGV